MYYDNYDHMMCVRVPFHLNTSFRIIYIYCILYKFSLCIFTLGVEHIPSETLKDIYNII